MAARKAKAKSGKSKAEKNTEEWKHPKQVFPDKDVFDRWVDHWLRADEECGGRWRPIKERIFLKKIKELPNDQKVTGLLAKVGDTHNLYFKKDLENFNIGIFYHTIQKHPLTAHCEPLGKSEGQWRPNKEGKLTWHPDHHLSSNNIGIRTYRNFSVLGGCTMNGDGKQGMTHARMKITQGQHFQTDALQIVANWL